jgi:hypothetical protein
VGVMPIKGFDVAVKGKVPTVPGVNTAVPVPEVTATVCNVGLCVAVNVAVGFGCVWVGALVTVITTGVLLGASVGVGRDSMVCATCTATVACRSVSEMGAGLAVACGWSTAGHP